jgi:hypothetical protein
MEIVFTPSQMHTCTDARASAALVSNALVGVRASK